MFLKQRELFQKNSELNPSSLFLTLQILVWQHPFRGRHCRVSRSLICKKPTVNSRRLCADNTDL